MKLPHGRELLMILPLSELYGKYAYHERLQVFAEKGRVCVACDRVGTFLILSRETNACKQSRKRKSIHRIHLDLYTDDFVLMTVDHMVPKAEGKALGWPKEAIESIDNKQPMCDPCNNKKGNNPVSNEIMRSWRKGTNKPIESVEIIRQLVPNIHEMLGDYNVITV